MKQSLLILFSLCLIIAISGCTIPETCILYNNTGQDLNVIQISKHEDRKTERKFVVGSSIKIGEKGWLAFTYRIVARDTVWNYEPIMIDEDYVVDSGFNRIFKAQLEKDGHIYILQPDQSFLASEFPKQPEGFPLLPQ